MKIFSGIQPSGNLHIGNYLGAIKQFVGLQKNNEAIFCVVDQHAITVPQDPEKLREKTLEVAMIYLASGIDPQKSIVFVQSHVPAHTELGWILNTLTPLGELERMTQFKDKSGLKEKEKKIKNLLKKPFTELSAKEIDKIIESPVNSVYAGLLSYPTLMAADILLYQTETVPVGEDQIQHIEFARMIAEKFNNRFGETFTLPKPLVDKNTKRIMALDDPSKKMSKSAISEHSYIFLLDNPETIRHKVKIAVTDSQTEIGFDLAGKPAISNLLNVYSAFSNKPTDKITKKYLGKGYAEFKKDLAEVIIEGLSHLQHKFNELVKDQEMVLDILRQGSKKAEKIASKTLSEVKKKMGFLL